VYQSEDIVSALDIVMQIRSSPFCTIQVHFDMARWIVHDAETWRTLLAILDGRPQHPQLQLLILATDIEDLPSAATDTMLILVSQGIQIQLEACPD
jgi:hypothetical protein